MALKSSKPEYIPKGVGVEIAEPLGSSSDEKRKKKDKGKGWRRYFSVGAWLRLILTVGCFGLLVHGLFIMFGVYERNRHLTNADHFALLIKLVVFVALMYLFYAVLMHYGPIRHRVRGIFLLALAPVTALCVFMIYAGSEVFGSFVPVLQFLILTVSVGGFLLYIASYMWLSGRKARREAAKNGDPGLTKNDAANKGSEGLPPPVQGDRRRVHKPGNLRLRSTDGGDGPSNGTPRRKIELPDV
ncbi:hypothetical protein LPB41_05420 [Thalassospira sp. MA62]|nr:hypothetical protein [Thalassospira sp. MA62]